MNRRTVLWVLVIAAVAVLPLFAGGTRDAEAGQTIKLIGHTMLPKEHVYFRTVQKFADLTS